MHRSLAPTTRRTAHRRAPAALAAAAVLATGLIAGACTSDQAEVDTKGGSTSTTGTTETTRPDGEREGTDGEVDEGVEVAGDGYQGWILDPDADAEWLFPDGEGVWLTPDDVASAEAVLVDGLPDELEEAEKESEWYAESVAAVIEDFDTYLRQYEGAIEGDAVIVYVNGLCTDDVGGEDALRTTMVMVDDGGPCFWNAKVDIDAGEIVSIQINGMA